jgi:hypothetical protein
VTQGTDREIVGQMGILNDDVLRGARERELLVAHESILAELRRREVVRTNDAPVGQWAEWLAREVLRGTLEPNSKKGFDLLTPEGRKVQVKARLVRDEKKRSERLLSVFRSFDFDDCLVLLFDQQYEVRKAVLLSAKEVEAHARMSKHVNGHLLFATDAVLQLGRDVKQQFSAP